MKILILIMASLLCFGIVHSQERAIQITQPDAQKEIIIKEGKRIRVKTTDGKTMNGRYYIVDHQHIRIRSHQIALDDITKIKKNPFALVLINAAALLMPAAIVGLFAGFAAAELVLPVIAGYVYSSFSVNVLKGYEPSENLQLELITLPGNH